jgi:4-diphosphocytidyl-2-C-methyl-D-erythritol kinase
MYLQKSGTDVLVQAPAKLNLFFEVLSKRDDGYHEVETLVYPIALYDTLYFRDHPSGQIEFVLEETSAARRFSGTGAAQVPRGADNLVVRAVELLKRRAGVSRGASLQLVKRIPSEAGMGGGSSDAAAALMAANAGWDLGWSRIQLQQLGAELGSDVPLFFVPGPTVCRGRGERVEVMSGLGNLHFVVVRPPVGLSTADVYGACRPAAGGVRTPAPLVEALTEGDLGRAGRLLFNRLEPAAETLAPPIRRVRRQLAAVDCLGFQMTGSGSCHFGLCRHARHARRVAGRLQTNGWGTALAVRGS